MKTQLLVGLMVLAMLAPAVYSASCSADAYKNACSQCSFDANGKIDASCMSSKKNAGIACTSAAYPVTATKYSQGQCPGVDACATELSSCTAQYSSGNDKADCMEGSVSVCYAAADSCMQGVAAKCEGIENPCSSAPAALLLVLLGGLFAAYKGKSVL